MEKPSREVIEHILRISYNTGSVSEDYNYRRDVDFILKNWDLTDNEINRKQWKRVTVKVD